MKVPWHRHNQIGGWPLVESGARAEGDLVSFDATSRVWKFRAKLTAIAHAMTSAAHTASNWSVFYSNGSGAVTEVALGASGTALVSTGTAAAPTAQSVVTVLTRTAVLDLVSSTTETDILNYTVPGGLMSTNRTLRFKCSGFILYNNNAANTLAIRVYFGGSLDINVTHLPANDTLSADIIPFTLEVTVTNRDSASVQGIVATMLEGIAQTGIGYQVGAGGVSSYGSFLAYGFDTKNTAGDMALRVSALWSANSANNDLYVLPGTLELL